MACVRKRRNSWVLDYYDQHGVRRREVVRGGTRKDAEALLAERVRDVTRGEYEPRSRQRTFADLARAFETAHIDTRVRFATAKDYRTNLRLHIEPFFGAMRLRTLTPQDIEDWQAERREKNVGTRTINKSHMLLGVMLRYAERHGWVTRNVARLVPKLRDEKTMSEDTPLADSILNPAEIRRLLEVAGDRWRPLLYMAIATGLRQGELLGLTWGDIDWNAKQVFVRRQFSKGRFADLKTRHSRRLVPLSEDLAAELKRWKLRCPKPAPTTESEVDTERELVFPHADGRPLNHGLLLRNGFRPAMRRAKLRQIRFHDLRHTFASLLIRQNVHPKRIQALMGHSTIRITMDTYGHLMKDHDDGAAEKIAALIAGEAPTGHQTVTTSDGGSSKSLKELEAGVGIEPAYTALQAAA